MGRGFALFAGAAPEIIRASAREAEGLGYSSFWVNHPGATDGLRRSRWRRRRHGVSSSGSG